MLLYILELFRSLSLDYSGHLRNCKVSRYCYAHDTKLDSVIFNLIKTGLYIFICLWRETGDGHERSFKKLVKLEWAWGGTSIDNEGMTD